MVSKKSVPHRTFAIAIGLLVLALCTALQGETHFRALHYFSGSDGAYPWSGVIVDSGGGLLGTVPRGGSGVGYGGGMVFRLTPGSDGRWIETVLHRFVCDGEAGCGPLGGVIVGLDGNIYGTTYHGGAHDLGTVFKLTSSPSGWKESVLYSFGAHSDDAGEPYAGVAMDSAGNLYGTSPFHGSYEGGAVFQLTPTPSGWNESVIHDFCTEPSCDYDVGAYSGVIVDEAGNLYGTTMWDGAHHGGTVYRLLPTTNGWTYQVLYNFGDSRRFDGYFANAPLIMDQTGNLYGTTTLGGRFGGGTVFRLEPGPDGNWKESILHEFKDFKYPAGGVVMDAAGNLYGTTVYGGPCDCGLIYKLSPNPDDTWTYSILHRFNGADGSGPESSLVIDKQGHLYGSAVLGGPSNYGIIFELIP